MSDVQRTISPVDGKVLIERPYADAAAVDATLERASRARVHWRNLPLEQRAAQLNALVDALLAQREPIAEEITRQMGRPISQSPGELRGFEERARHMIGIAHEALADVSVAPKPGFHRYIRRVPLGTVFTIAPWNFPLLTAVNSVVPALMAGNSVVLKHSGQTPLVAERFVEAARAAGLPEGVLQYLHLTHSATERVIGDSRVDFVCFTGSVGGGHAVQAAAGKRFIGTGLELGGKDPAYVRADADLAQAADGIVDGAFFNSGQSCCGIERVYVHRSVYDEFVERAVELVKAYRLGNPLQADTNLGPMVRPQAAEFVRRQTADAVAAGARALIDPAHFAADEPGSAYLAPQVLVDVDHSMRVMTEESFGPVVGIMAVDSDEAAVALMDDSDYGLTASVWTRDAGAAMRLGDRLETGTVFMNRCDYLDPALAWVGVKDSGRGCTLSRVGYEALTRPKSFHLRVGS